MALYNCVLIDRLFFIQEFRAIIICSGRAYIGEALFIRSDVV